MANCISPPGKYPPKMKVWFVSKYEEKILRTAMICGRVRQVVGACEGRQARVAGRKLFGRGEVVSLGERERGAYLLACEGLADDAVFQL